MNFASDNWAGVADPIAEAIAEARHGAAPAYGGDELTKRAERAFSDVFEHEVAVFFVTTGTAANTLALTSLAKPGGLVLCHEDAHINTDEAGAAEFLADLKLIALKGQAGKVSPETLSAAIDRYPPDPGRYGQPVAVSLSNLTESGTTYSAADVEALSELAKGTGLYVHMDGARFGNAVAGLGATPAELTWKAGVDILSFGGTKNGCWLAEAVVFFDPAMAAQFAYIRKRAGHLISKQRFVAVQFEAYLKDGLWLDLAGRANRMAAKLAEGVTAAGGRLAWPVDGNEVFAILPEAALKRARSAGARFYEWTAERLPPAEQPADGEEIVRLVASFATTEDEITHFLKALR